MSGELLEILSWLELLCVVAGGVALCVPKARPRAAPLLFFAAACLFTAEVLMSGRYGTDLRVFCGAVRAERSGLDPYLVAHLGRFSGMPLSFAYPALTLPFFRLLCADPKLLFPLFYVALLLLSFRISRRPGGMDDAYLAALLSSGFVAFHWCLRTGNIGILELFLLAILFWLLRTGRPRAAALCLGPISFFKLLPLGFALGFSGLPAARRLRNTAALAGYAALSFVALQLASFLYRPELFRHYALQVAGKIPGQHSPVLETLGGASNPTFLLLLRDLARAHLGGEPALIALVVLGAAGCAVMATRVAAWNRGEPLKAFSFIVLAVLLWLPRLKPYSLTHALLPLFFLTRDYEERWKAACLGLACLVPYAAFLGLASHPVLGPYAQTISLAAVILLAYAREAAAQRGEEPQGR